MIQLCLSNLCQVQRQCLQGPVVRLGRDTCGEMILLLCVWSVKVQHGKGVYSVHSTDSELNLSTCIICFVFHMSKRHTPPAIIHRRALQKSTVNCRLASLIAVLREGVFMN